MNKSPLLLILCFFFSYAVIAQENATTYKDRFFNLGIGYTLPKFIDNSFSSLQYQGPAVAAIGSFYFHKPLRQHHLYFRFDYGQLSNATNLAKVDYFRSEGNYVYRKYLKSFWHDKIQWFAGGSVNGLWSLWIHNNFINNAFNNSVYVSLSPNSSLVYSFDLFRRQFRAEVSAFIPVLTFAMRPAYGASNFPGFLDDEREDTFKQILESGKLVSFNKFFRYSNTFSLEYELQNANRLRLSYEWNFLRYSEPRLVKAASHNITFSTMFNF